jgi:hypothetical protein
MASTEIIENGYKVVIHAERGNPTHIDPRERDTYRLFIHITREDGKPAAGNFFADEIREALYPTDGVTLTDEVALEQGRSMARARIAQLGSGGA